jgi:dienelactone hydrolase
MMAGMTVTMRRIAVSMLWLAFAGPGMCGAAAPDTPLNVYGRLPSIEHLAISPDGTRIASIQTIGDQRDLWILRLDGGKPIHAGRVGDAKVRGLLWGDNDNLFITISSTSLPPVNFYGPRREWFTLEQYRLSKDKLSAVSFQVVGERVFNVIDGEPVVRTVNGTPSLFFRGLYVVGDVLSGLFKYDIASGTLRLVAKSHDPGSYATWLLNDAGQVAAELDYQGATKDWRLKLPHNDVMAPVLAGNAPIDVPALMGFGPTGDSLVMELVEGGDNVFKPLKFDDQTWGPPIGNDPPFEDLLVGRNTSRVIGGFSEEPEPHYVFFDNELQAKWNAVHRAFPGDTVHMVSAADGDSRMIVEAVGPKDGYVYALFDWYTHRSLVIGNVYEGLGAVFEVKRITYPAADGFSIPGYLTLPKSAAADGTRPTLPLIVLPHGGPEVADHYGFDWWAQALAAQGYAVLQPNYRGSALGYRFVAAGFGEWGRKMQTDLSDGVRFLAKQGIIDPKRVCIVGASYGGYAALAGVTLDPGVYRCTVSVAGLSDLSRLLRRENNIRNNSSDTYGERYWERFMGVSGAGDPALKAISPIDHVDSITAPVLLIHGLDDTVVPYEQSALMRDAMKRGGKSVDLVTLKREDHWLSRPETRQQMLEATVAFLKANNPPD